MGTYAEDDFLQLSALQHFLFCKRQCALIHIEQIWFENIFTAEGRVLHEKAHEGPFEIRDGVRIERGMYLRSDTLGLNGQADVIEFHKNEKGQLMPLPVEYKRGKPKENGCDTVQLCAQAICVEEMLNVVIPCGALFYGKTRHRLDVTFDDTLRQTTKKTAEELHVLIKTRVTPRPEYAKKCESCSLLDACKPKLFSHSNAVTSYLKTGITEE